MSIPPKAATVKVSAKPTKDGDEVADGVVDMVELAREIKNIGSVNRYNRKQIDTIAQQMRLLQVAIAAIQKDVAALKKSQSQPAVTEEALPEIREIRRSILDLHDGLASTSLTAALIRQLMESKRLVELLQE